MTDERGDGAQTLGKRIQELREDKGWRTRKAFAEKVGISPSTLGHIEKGESQSPLDETLALIAETLAGREGKEALLEELIALRDIAPPKPGSDPSEPYPTAYLEALVTRHAFLNIAGLGSGAGAIKTASRYPVEELYTPLRSADVPTQTPDRAQPIAAREGHVLLSEILPRHPRLLLVGQPGAGKTTFIKLLATMLGRDALGIEHPEGGSWCEQELGLPKQDKPKIPAVVRAAALLERLREAGARPLARGFLAEELEIAHKDGGLLREHWAKWLEEGRAWLLLDGLDEVADPRAREALVAVVRDAAERWRCPITATTRPIDLEGLEGLGFARATIDPFGDSEIREFIRRWVGALYEQSSDDFRGEAADYHPRLLRAIVDRPRVKRLATNPVMLTCLSVVHWNEGHLPEGRSRVYQAVLRWLVAARMEQRRKLALPCGVKIRSELFVTGAFAHLALGMMGGEPPDVAPPPPSPSPSMWSKLARLFGGPSSEPEAATPPETPASPKRALVDLEEAVRLIDPIAEREWPSLTEEDRRRASRIFLHYECAGSGIIEALPPSSLRFWHLTFQEYLAALQLAWLNDGEDPARSYWPILRPNLHAAQWRETTELLPGCLMQEGGVQRVDLLLARVAEDATQGATTPLLAAARITGSVGRLVQTVEVLGYRPSPELARALAEAHRNAMGIFELEGAAKVGWRERIEAAEALGQAGDPRLRPDVDNFLPVPDTEIALGKYPVTVEEYQRFAEHNGYTESRHWSPEGWSWRQEEGIDAPGSWEEQLLHPNRPVVGVSWWEAEAYCAWLTRQKGLPHRLPTETEWLAAADGDPNAFPWGKEKPTLEHANFAKNVNAPSPVGVYPLGAGPHGHLDLGGNVDEWSGEHDEAGNPWRGGGSWLEVAWDLRTGRRLRSRAWVRVVRLGFRVAVSPSRVKERR